jgi:hypothetical protein
LLDGSKQLLEVEQEQRDTLGRDKVTQKMVGVGARRGWLDWQVAAK